METMTIETRPAKCPAWPLASELPPMGALATAPATARAHIRATLTAWSAIPAARPPGQLAEVTGLAEVTEVAEFVASELVTNAVRASAGPGGQPVYAGGRMPVIRLRLFSDGVLLLIEVWDQAPGIPQPRNPDIDAESGRGLLLVDQLTGSRWGWRPVTDGPGKCVWAELGGA